jgi:hypothetical protein
MQSTAWISLIRQIPETHHEKLMLVTTAGVEICINSFVVLGEEFVLLRGRLSGTTDTGRAFFLPYNQINYLGYQIPVNEADLRRMMGAPVPEPQAAAKAPEPAPEPAAVAPPPEAFTPPAPPTEEPPEKTAPVEPPKPAARTTPMAKNALLERLRARSNAGAPRPPAGT